MAEVKSTTPPAASAENDQALRISATASAMLAARKVEEPATITLAPAV
jgi:hypothetical protein